eukprot:3048725-Prymnesium_polylepis.1
MLPVVASCFLSASSALSSSIVGQARRSPPPRASAEDQQRSIGDVVGGLHGRRAADGDAFRSHLLR